MPFTLPAATGAASLTDAATTEAQQKTNLTNLRGFIAEMLGTDSTSRDTARSLLGIDPPTLTATVAASALTIALKSPAAADGSTTAPISIAFRSATLTSGVLNVRKVTAALSLVVPSTATLGTVSATQSRLVVLAIDNSGTVELAVVNISGGNDLTETGVITTTAISGAATAANVAYSTVARTGVPYRVLGYVESTQATAGTWATAPSTIQSFGGNAVAAMSALGYGQTWQSPARSLATNYYNTTGKPILVVVTCGNGSGLANGAFTLTVAGVIVGESGISGNGGSTGALLATITAVVPPGAVYSAQQSTATITLNRWTELR